LAPHVLVAVVIIVCAAAGGAGGEEVEVVVDGAGAVRLVGSRELVVNGSVAVAATLARLDAAVAELQGRTAQLEQAVQQTAALVRVAEWGCWGVCEGGGCGSARGVRRRVSIAPTADVVDTIECAAPCFPDWRNLTAAGRAQFMDALGKLVAPAGCARVGGERETTFGSTAQWYQESALAPNGMIYVPPGHITGGQFLKIDPVRETVTAFGPSMSGYVGAALAPNGDVYAIPTTAARVARIVTHNDTVVFLASNFGGGEKWVGGVLGPNGCVYGMPLDASSVLRINTTSDDATTFGTVSGAADKYHGGVLAPNGLIYAIPWKEMRVLVIDPGTDMVWLMGSVGNLGWSYGVMDVRGIIFGFPYDDPPTGSRGVLRIDPVANTSAIVQEGSGPLYLDYMGAALGPDGHVYGGPSHLATGVLRLDTATMNSTKLGRASGYRCPTLVESGALVFTPTGSRNVLKLSFPYLPPMSLPMDALLSPFLN
jgi:hypothetical protein